MSKRARIIFGIAAGLVLVMVAGGIVFWYVSGQPLYEPGMVRASKNLRAPLDPPRQSAANQCWQVEPDICLAHFETGAGKNVMVIHGGSGVPYVKPWTGLEPLTSTYRFSYYDQRGSGNSTRPFDRFTSGNFMANVTALEQTLGIGAQAADIERIRRILGDDKLILVGHSWGGLLAALYAAEFPEHVQALVLVSPADALVMPQASGGLFAAVRERLPTAQQAAYDDWYRRYMDFGNLFSKCESELAALNEEFGSYYAQAAGAPPVAQGKPGGWMVWANYLSMGQRHDWRNALKNVTAPALVIHGADDLQTEQASRVYADAFPHAQFKVIAAAGHFSFEQNPHAFASIVSDFLTRNSTQRGY